AETNVSRVGSGSVTVTAFAVDGPLLVTTIVNAIVDPGVAPLGPFLVIIRSACCTTGNASDALLLPEFGSDSVALIVAVLVIVPLAASGTLNVTVNTCDAPEARLPMLQGKVPHGAVVEMKINPGGAGSSTVTFVAVDGPAFAAFSE